MGAAASFLVLAGLSPWSPRGRASSSITCGPRRAPTKNPWATRCLPPPQHPGAAPCPSPAQWHPLRGAQCLCPVPLSPPLLETPCSIPRDGCWCSRDAPGSLPGIPAPLHAAEQRGPGRAPGSPPPWGCLGTPRSAVLCPAAAGKPGGWWRAIARGWLEGRGCLWGEGSGDLARASPRKGKQLC